MAEHTPTPPPWRVHEVLRNEIRDDKWRIAACSRHEALDFSQAAVDAAWIVRCVNSHLALIDALAKVTAAALVARVPLGAEAYFLDEPIEAAQRLLKQVEG